MATQLYSSVTHRSSITRKPDAARVYQSYLHICDTQGKRGALRRVGEIYGISHETVRRYVLQYEAVKAPEEPADVRYIPPPYSYPEPIKPTVSALPNGTPTAEIPLIERDKIMSSETASDEATPALVATAVPNTAHDEMAQPHTVELESLSVIAPETAQPVMVHERIAERVKVVRIPAEQPRRGVYDRLSSVQWESIMGPELGVVIAAILIVVTWGFR